MFYIHLKIKRKLMCFNLYVVDFELFVMANFKLYVILTPFDYLVLIGSLVNFDTSVGAL